MSIDVSREPEVTSGEPEPATLDHLRKELAGLHVKVDELLTDSRAARPLLERYLSMTSGRVGAWVGVSGGKGRRR